MTILLFTVRVLFTDLFRNLNRVNRSTHGGGAKKISNLLECEGENCYIPSGEARFLKCKNCIFKKVFTKEYFEFTQS